jgi:hypothetical protein
MRQQREQAVLVAEHELLERLRVVIAHLKHEPNIRVGQRIPFGSRLANRQRNLECVGPTIEPHSAWPVGGDTACGLPNVPYSSLSVGTRIGESPRPVPRARRRPRRPVRPNPVRGKTFRWKSNSFLSSRLLPHLYEIKNRGIPRADDRASRCRCTGVVHAPYNALQARSGRPSSIPFGTRAAAWHRAGSLQCFAKTNVGYGSAGAILNFELRPMSSDPTRARYLPVPNTARHAAADCSSG